MFSNSALSAEIIDQPLAAGVAVLSLKGDITLDDAARFQAISQKYDKVVVVLDSAGGRLFPALEIGRIIKAKGYMTLVPDDAICASACALIWISSTSRFLSPLGNVGFHASYRDNGGKFEESGVANALIGNYLTKLDFSENAIIFATSAPPSEILWLNQDNKISAEIDFYDYVSEDVSSIFTHTLSSPRDIVILSGRKLDCALINAGHGLRNALGVSMAGDGNHTSRQALFKRLRTVVDQCVAQYDIPLNQKEDYFQYSLASISREWLMMDIAKYNLTTGPVDRALDFGERKKNPDISRNMSNRQIEDIVNAYIYSGVEIDSVSNKVWEKVGAYAAATSIYWNKRNLLPF